MDATAVIEKSHLRGDDGYAARYFPTFGLLDQVRDDTSRASSPLPILNAISCPNDNSSVLPSGSEIYVHASLACKERLSLRLCDKTGADTFSSAVRITGDTENKVMVVTGFYSNQAEHMLAMASQQNFASFDARPMIIRHRLGWVG